MTMFSPTPMVNRTVGTKKVKQKLPLEDSSLPAFQSFSDAGQILNNCKWITGTGNVPGTLLPVPVLIKKIFLMNRTDKNLYFY
jgi:hypothetical protein